MSMSGQKLKEAKADQQYDKFAYVDAIKTYERIFACLLYTSRCV